MTPEEQTDTGHDSHVVSVYTWGTGKTVQWTAGASMWVWVLPPDEDEQPEEPEAEDAA